MDKQKELRILKQALKDYRKSRWYPLSFSRVRIDALYTSTGFCQYFRCKGFMFPTTLSLLRPTFNYGGGFWFRMGKLNPRIKLLKQAIKTLENENN